MTNGTQPSQQVPVAMSHAEICEFMPPEMMFGDSLQPHHLRHIINAVRESIAPDAGLAEDAKRYRFLSGKDGNRHEPIENAMLFVAFDANDTHELDAAIDALASQEPHHG